MFKLLTEEERQKVAHEYAMRRLIVMLCALILVLVVGIIGLFPSYLLSNVHRIMALERTKIAGSAEQRNEDLGLQVWLEEINRKLQLLSPTLDTDRPSHLIKKILDQKNEGIIITGFSSIKTKDKTNLSVSGVSANRQSLITFENRIASLSDFSEVVSPISNLAKDKDINFQIRLSSI